MAFDFIPEAWNVPKLAFCDRGFEVIAAAFVFQDLRAVEPMLDVAAHDKNSRMIGLAWAFSADGVRLEDVIQSGGDACAVMLFGIGFALFINHLIFVADG
jgi:hypothetical protein